jgi:AcrR family transcriptional regulator
MKYYNPNQTRNKIVNAFIDLLKNKRFGKITVKEIIENADINRSTFYAYYLDKYDLLEKVEADYFKGLGVLIDNVILSLTESDVQEIVKVFSRKYAEYMYDHGEMFLCFTHDEDIGPSFNVRVNQSIQALWSNDKGRQHLTIGYRYACAILIGMAANLIFEWVRNDMKESPDEIADIFQKTVSIVMNNILV